MNTSTPRLPQHVMLWLGLGVVLTMLPHTLRVPIWISLIHFSLVSTRVLVPNYFPLFWLQNRSYISLSRLLIMLFSFIGIYTTYGTLVGRDAGVSLLIILSSLKVLECNNDRDFYITTCLGYFLTITNFFYSQTIPVAIYMCFVIIFMTVILITYNDKQQTLTLLERFRLSSTMLLQAFPVMLVFFLLFPRVNGPLWGMPKDAYTGITGIDDEMSPGSISKLAQSSKVAFRVSFTNEIPELNSLYWRGPVLWHTDGRKWTAGRSRSNESVRIKYQGKIIEYDVTLEPTNKHWLFAIEMPFKLPENSYMTHDYQLKSSATIQTRRRYSISSHPSFIIDTASSSELQRALTLPYNKHQQVRALAANWNKDRQTPEAIIQQGLDFFRAGDFVYTLEPPLLHGDTIDAFLFDIKRGFCEHYAASFTVLMRAAGIPARVVTGYQGGEINPVGNYLIVRQHHAHAWSEVWLDKRGWVRIDPTFVVSPARINEGLENALPDSIIDIPLGLENNPLAVGIWQKLRNQWDAVNYRWTQWVLGYGPDRQKAFFAKLGFKQTNWRDMTTGMVIIVALAFIITALWMFGKPGREKDPAKLLYKMFCKQLAKVGINKRNEESPNSFAKRASDTRYDLKNEIESITGVYMDIRYGSQFDKLRQLKLMIINFNPGKAGTHITP